MSMDITAFKRDDDRSRRVGFVRGILVVASLALAAIIGVVALPGAAGAARNPVGVERLLAFYPGSVRIDERSVEVEPGVVVSLPSDIGIQATCTFHYLCLFSSENLGGYQISFYICAFRNLGTYAYPTGGYWNDKLSSLINNQTSGVKSSFYNYLGGGNWDLRFTSTANDTKNTIGSHNNIVDGVQVC